VGHFKFVEDFADYGRNLWEKRRRLRTSVRSHEVLLIPVALVIGILVGCVVPLMSAVAQFAHVLIYGIPLDVRLSASTTVTWWVALVAPVAGGAILGFMEFARRKWKIASAVDPIEANALRGGRLSLRDSIVVSIQTMVSNGCGASVGLEAGYTQIAAGMASLFGRCLNLRRSDMRLMVGCGAGAAIAAAFGAPFAGSFYACELIVGVYSVGSATPILAASLSASVVANWLGGAPYSLEVLHTSNIAFQQYPSLICLALMATLIGIAVMRSIEIFEKLFSARWIPVWGGPIFGGLCVGGMAIATPQVLAAGHGAMVLDLNREMAISLIAGLILLKVCACLISLGSGFRGGLFFASLFIGSLLGKLFAIVWPHSMFGVSLDPTASTLAGMASLGVAIVGGPLTMSFLVLEMTRNLDLAAAVLAPCFVTNSLVRATFGHSFSTWRLHLRGETIRSANDVGWLRGLIVSRLMRSDVPKLRSTATMAECRSMLALGSYQGIVVVDDDDRYRGVIMSADLYSGLIESPSNGASIISLARHSDTFLRPSMNVKAAMEHFDRAEAELLAVVSDDAHLKVVGYLTESYARRRYAEELDQATQGIV
jgi:CIC family chloride channel protein